MAMLPAAARAGEWQPLTAIARAAENAVSTLAATESVAGRKMRIEIVAMDPRLRVASCSQPLQTHIPAGAAQSPRPVVEVSCAGHARWRLNVPVAVYSELPVLIALRNLPRGALLSSQDFAAAQRSFAGLAHNKFVTANRLAGRRLQRPLASGSVLEYGMLESLWSVRRGQPVTLLARSDAFEIRAQGVALRDGQLGERLPVRNANTQKVIEGVVTGESTVLVQP
jgi:flagella basal body P-ring formation protein FlgA